MLYYCIYSHSILSVWHPKSPRQPHNLSPIHLLLEYSCRQVTILYLLHLMLLEYIWAVCFPYGSSRIFKKRELVVSLGSVKKRWRVWRLSHWQQWRCLAPPKVPPGKTLKNHRSNLSWSSKNVTAMGPVKGAGASIIEPCKANKCQKWHFNGHFPQAHGSTGWMCRTLS